MSMAMKWVVAAACAGLVACQTQPVQDPRSLGARQQAKSYKVKECRTQGANRCEVGVRVLFTPQGTPYLAIDDADMFLGVKKSQAATIRWKLSVVPSPNAPGYKDGDFEFAASGIDFGTASAQIPCSRKDRITYECEASRLTNDGLTAYKYSINVFDTTGTNTTVSLDPWVVAD